MMAADMVLSNGFSEEHGAIEVAAGDYVVEVHSVELPTEASEMVSLLMNESAHLSVWIDVAKAYLAEGMHAQYEHVLKYAAAAAKALCATLQV